jgi:hypothetical protein
MNSLLSTLNFRQVALDNMDEVVGGMKLYLRLACSTYHLSVLPTQLEDVVSNFLASAKKHNGVSYVILIDKQEIGWLYYYKDKNNLVIKNIYLDPKYHGKQIASAIFLALAQLYKLTIQFDILANNRVANSFAKKMGASLSSYDSCIINNQYVMVNNYSLAWQSVVGVLKEKINADVVVKIRRDFASAMLSKTPATRELL